MSLSLSFSLSLSVSQTHTHTHTLSIHLNSSSYLVCNTPFSSVEGKLVRSVSQGLHIMYDPTCTVLNTLVLNVTILCNEYAGYHINPNIFKNTWWFTSTHWIVPSGTSSTVVHHHILLLLFVLQRVGAAGETLVLHGQTRQVLQRLAQRGCVGCPPCHAVEQSPCLRCCWPHPFL